MMVETMSASRDFKEIEGKISNNRDMGIEIKAQFIVNIPSEEDICKQHDRLMKKNHEWVIENDNFYKVLIHPVLKLMLLSKNVEPNIKGKDVVDFCCATGGTTRELAKWGAKRVLGIDISSKMVKKARETVGEEFKNDSENQVGFIEKSITNLNGINDSSFDVGTCIMGMEFTNIPIALAEMSRVIKKSGRLILTLSHPDINQQYLRVGNKKDEYFCHEGWVIESGRGDYEYDLAKQYFHFSSWINMFIQSPWIIKYTEELMPNKTIERYSPKIAKRHKNYSNVIIFDLINKK